MALGMLPQTHPEAELNVCVCTHITHRKVAKRELFSYLRCASNFLLFIAIQF